MVQKINTNSSSDYYNNICSKANSEKGVYIPLSDRKKDFIDNNMTLCEENCKFVDYDYKNKKARCSCEIKLRFPLINEVKFDEEELYKSFTDIKNIANLNLMKCFKNVFKKECIVKNWGLYIFIVIIIIFIICFIIFCFKYRSFEKKIHKIYVAKKGENKKIICSHNQEKAYNKKTIKDYDLNTKKIIKNIKEKKMMKIFHLWIITKKIKRKIYQVLIIIT